MNSKAEARTVISEVLAELVPARLGKALRGIVLTGSLARDEATVLPRYFGFELLGDVDLLLVFDASSSIPDGMQIGALRYEVEGRCLDRGLRATVHPGSVSRRYFRKLPKSIFAYELKHCAKIIWGDTQILTLIPEFSADQIPHEDAWRMISNRMIELMAASCRFIQNTTTLDQDLQYATVKMFLDMATSYLVFAGEYRPSYRERAERLLALANEGQEVVPFRLAKFAARLQQCTVWKLSGEFDNSGQVLELWHEAIRYLRRLWRWEMIQLTSANGEQTIGALVESLAAKQTRAALLRGWLSVTKRCGWLRSWRRWPQWLQQCLRVSPRYVVYGAAAEVVFLLPCLMNQKEKVLGFNRDWNKIRAHLPVSTHHNNLPAWQALICDVIWNYDELLVGTHV